jgi:hypothetical protein
MVSGAGSSVSQSAPSILLLMATRKTPAKRTARTKRAAQAVEGDCLIPPRPSNMALNQFAFKRDDAEAQRVADYVEGQCKKERVTFLEKMFTEHVMGIAYDCWNVHTNKLQYWVIDGHLMNLYSQKLFPSLDYLLSFHIGLMLRVDSERTGTEDPRLADRIAAAFRLWEQAAEALDKSNESEDVQAVGVRCRETLLTFLRAVSDLVMVPPGETAPKAASFKEWTILIANHVAAGHRNADIRSYLKALAQQTWDLVNWLTHTAHVSRIDGTMAIDATHSVLEAFGAALVRHERQTPERCGRCGSLRLMLMYMPEFDTDGAICQTCGFLMKPAGAEDAVSPIAVPLGRSTPH